MLRRHPVVILLIFFLLAPTILILRPLLIGNLYAQDYTGEKILYLISPFGRAEYADLGLVELDGQKARLITFKTQVLWLEDTEKIYAQPDTLLPVKVERDVATWFGREYIVESYDQKNFILTTTKFNESKKKIGEQVVKTKGPIQNAILLAFYPRLNPKLDVGWSFKIMIPSSFGVKLVSIDDVLVPAGRFKAYHFVSSPDKFELWIKKDAPMMPVKIVGKGGLGYSLVMKEYAPAQQNVK